MTISITLRLLTHSAEIALGSITGDLLIAKPTGPFLALISPELSAALDTGVHTFLRMHHTLHVPPALRPHTLSIPSFVRAVTGLSSSLCPHFPVRLRHLFLLWLQRSLVQT